MEYTLKRFRTAPSGIDYKAFLNSDQWEAASSPPGPLLVIAGAGSGKTRTLTYRVAWLTDQGVPPEEILLLTFTNKAAREMLRRVEDLLRLDVSRIWGGTFHHVGHRILRRHATEAGLGPGFTILDREDAKDLLAAALSESDIGILDKRFPKPQVLLEIFGLAQNTEREIAEVLSRQFSYFLDMQEDIVRAASLYHARKTEANAVDYDDLLAKTATLFHCHPEILNKYRARFQHVLVDEYQDTNKIQADIVDALAGEKHQVMAVGDDAQSIYSWRGANFENIMSFPQRHPGARVIRIETNYRSTPEILGLANAAISQNQRQYPKNLRACRPTGPKPVQVALDNSRQQAAFLAQRVLELRDQGTALRDIAVLYRSHFHSMEVQMELTRQHIPFAITSGLRFFEQAHIKDVAAFLRFALNRRDEVSFKRVALMLPGIGLKTAGKLWRSAIENVPWNEAKVPPKAAEAWRHWGILHSELTEAIDNTPPSVLIDKVMKKIYREYLRARYPNYQNREDDIGQLAAFALSFDQTADFLGQLSLMTNLEAETSGSEGENAEAIKLSTIHQAKGLEWKIVFVIMLCEGLFPSARSIETQEGEEEERRLFYVAATRARDELYLSYPQMRGGAYGETWQKPSRFLSDFPKTYIDEWKIRTENFGGQDDLGYEDWDANTPF